MFKDYGEIQIKKEEVISELEKISNLGWDVFKKKSEAYVVSIDDSNTIILEEIDGEWFIELSTNGVPRYAKDVPTIEVLNNSLMEVSKILEINLKSEKINKSVRLKRKEPFSNKVKLLALFGNSKISKIFDPYFDPKAMITLLSLKKLGAEFDIKIECLTNKQLTIFDDEIIKDFNAEGNTNLEIKRCENKEHRRFIILNDKRIIILGCSLNDIIKNEVVKEEIQEEEKLFDNNFFNEQWVKAK